MNEPIRLTTLWERFRERAVLALTLLMLLGAVVAVQAAPPASVGGLTALPSSDLPLDVFLLYPNYRGMLFHDAATPAMKFRVKLTSGDTTAVTRMYAALKDENTGLEVLQRELEVAANVDASIDGASLAQVMAEETPYLLEVSVVKNGGFTYTYPAYRVSRVHASRRSEMTIAYDEKNRVLVNGVPRFILGVYDSGENVSDSQTDPAWWHQFIWAPEGKRRMNGLAANVYLNYWFGNTAATPMKVLMNTLQNRRADGIPLKNPAGMLYLQTGNCSHINPAIGGTWPFGINTPSYVQDLGAHAGLAGYYVMDKCDESLKPGVMAQYEGDSTASASSTAHQGLKRLDPDSMTFGVQGEQEIQSTYGIPLIAGWRDVADLLSTNPYPNAGAERDGPNGIYYHSKVADWTTLTGEEVQWARPYATVLQAFKYTTQGRWPTRREMRNHAYMAIVEGATGLWWFTLGTVSPSTGSLALVTVCQSDQWCAERTARMNDIRAVILELADLEAALLMDDGAAVSVANAAGGGPLAAIRTKVKAMPDGTAYVIAYNYSDTPLSARFTWSSPLTRPVVVNAEETICGSRPCARTIAVESDGRSFTDTFAPYQAHVYVLEDPAPTAAITSPTEGQTVKGKVRVKAAVSGGYVLWSPAVASSGYTYSFAVDGTVQQDGSSAEFVWDTTKVARGSHLLVLTVKDEGGAIMARATRTVVK
jgi:hypothetical protein